MKQTIDGHEIDVPEHLMPSALIEASDQHEENIKRKLDAHDDLVKALKAFMALDSTFTSICDAHLDELVKAQDPMAIAVSMARMAFAKVGVSA